MYLELHNDKHAAYLKKSVHLCKKKFKLSNIKSKKQPLLHLYVLVVAIMNTTKTTNMHPPHLT